MGQASASVRELKSKLSHYLRLTKAGESVVITERGVPIGRIVPMGPQLGELQAQWSGHKLRPAKPVAKLRGRRTVADLLVADRG